MRIAIEQSVIFNYIAAKSGINIRNLSDIYTLSMLSSTFFLLFSGIIFDKFGKRVNFIIANSCYFIATCCLILAFKNPWYIIGYSVLSKICDSFYYGKAEAAIYKDLYNTGNTQFFPKFLAVFYGISDLVIVVSMTVMTLLIEVNRFDIIIGMLFTSLALQCASSWMIYKMDSKPSDLKLSVITKDFFNNLRKNPNLINKLLTFGVYTSVMYIYKEIFVLTGKIYHLDPKNIAWFSTLYHACMSFGALVPIIIKNSFLLRIRQDVTYVMPVIMFGFLFTFSAMHSAVGILITVCCISFLFCIFEVCSDFDIDRSTAIHNIGSVNSLIWFLSSSFGWIISIIISFTARFFDQEELLIAPAGVYLLAASILYLRNKLKK